MKGLKIVLIVLCALVVLGALIFVSIIFEKPWWLGPAIMMALGAVLTGAWFMFLGLKKLILWLWHRKPSKKLYMETMSRNWKSAVLNIRKSDLKEKGDPFYVLPWYLVVGENGVGKTTAIFNSGLTAQIGTSLPEPENTDSCQWYFFEEAIVIDTPGRYVIPENPEQDRDEWGAFLKLFVKYRGKEPLNGVIITISADILLESTHEELEKRASSIWKSIQEIPKKMGVWVPIYLMVTKCDLIKGMKNFSFLLPDKKLSQAMGQLNNENVKEIGDFVDQTVDNLVEQLKRLRLALSFYSGTESVDPSAFFFPEEVSKIKSGLSSFAEGIFKKSVYEKNAVLRGVFFNSAKQRPALYSRLLSNFKPGQNHDVLPESNVVAKTEKSVFIRDLFREVFPSDRNFLSFTKSRLRQKRFFKYLRGSAVIILTVLMLQSIHKAYRGNYIIISEISRKLSQPFELGQNIEKDINTLEVFLENIEDVSELVETSPASAGALQSLFRLVSSSVSFATGGYFNPEASLWGDGSLMSYFMLTQGREQLLRLKQKYCRLYRTHMLSSLNNKIERSINHFSAETPGEVVGNTVFHLIRRVNFLRPIQKDKEDFLENIEDFIQPDGRFSAAQLDVSPTFSKKLETQYMYYLLWQNQNMLAAEKMYLDESLKNIMSNPDVSLDWIIALTDAKIPDAEITLNDFWKGGLQAYEYIAVSPSHTLEGKKWIDQIIVELRSAFPNSAVLERKISDFKVRYKNSFFDSWLKLVSSFEKGRMTLKNRQEAYFIVSALGTDMDPYFSLIKSLLENTSGFKGEADVPPWVELIREFDNIKSGVTAKKSSEKVNKGLFKTSIGRKIRKISKNINAQPESIKTLKEYLETLIKAKAEFVDSGEDAGFELVKQTFEGNPASAFIQVDKAFLAFTKTLPVSLLAPDNKVVMEFLRGQFRYLWSFAIDAAGSRLQKLWDAQVVSEYYDIREEEGMISKIFGEQGHVRMFIHTTAKPFMKKNGRQGTFVPASVFGEQIRFIPRFLSFIRKGYLISKIVGVPHEVVIKTTPTEFAGDELLPYFTKLEIKNSKSTQELYNYQNVVSKKFTLTPYIPNSVSLKIKIGDNLTLTKKYNGHYSLSSFVKDFKNGSCVFYPKDFPYQRKRLVKLGVKAIEVNIKLKGNERLRELLMMKLGTLPKTIIL